MKVYNVYLLTLLFSFNFVMADFDCEQRNNHSAACQTELRCIYDELYEGRVTFCRCRIVIIAVNFPNNILTYDLFKKVCSEQENNLQQLEINDVELETIDNKIFEVYKNLKFLNLAGNRIKTNFSAEAERIVELDLSFNELTHLKADTLSNLKSLKVLNLSFNKLEEVGSTFVELIELEKLYLNNNKLKVIRNNGFDRLKKLKILNLSNNLLVNLDSILVLNGLQELYLNDNGIAILNKEDFKNLTNLRILNVARNLISTVKAESIAKSKEPINKGQGFWIYFGDVSQKNKPQPSLQNPQNGGNIFTNSNNSEDFRTVFSQPFVQNSNIFKSFGNNLWKNQKGVFDFNPIQKNQQNSGLFFQPGNNPFIPNSRMKRSTDFSAWVKLQELNLAENRIRDIPGGFFDNLLELRRFNISHNELTDFDLDKFNASIKLTTLDVKRNNFRLDLKLLKNKWPLLKTIDFDLDLGRCGEFRDVFEHFHENGVVVKSCDSTLGCCGRLEGFS